MSLVVLVVNLVAMEDCKWGMGAGLTTSCLSHGVMYTLLALVLRKCKNIVTFTFILKLWQSLLHYLINDKH